MARVNSITYWLSHAQIKMNVSFFIAFSDAVIVTQNFVSRHLSIAAVSYIQFLNRRFQISISDWSCRKPTKDKNVKPDANAFDMLSASYLYDKLDNAL